MDKNTVTVKGMFGEGRTYFVDSPVVITISGLAWPENSPFNVIEVDVLYGGSRVGYFRFDTGRQTSIELDISSALRAIWNEYDFSANEVSAAQSAASSASAYAQTSDRGMRSYELKIYTEYLSSDDGGVFTRTTCGTFTGGQCLLGGMSELERSRIGSKENAHVASLQGTNTRYGDASTKPTSSPERVGINSITSYVDLESGRTINQYYSPKAVPGSDSTAAHAPTVLRDSQEYVDFLFVNRRGAVETCSALMMENLNVTVNTQHYGLVKRPSFSPRRSLMAIATGGRDSWNMSSGYQTREWAKWWASEFLLADQWWMLCDGIFVPVIVESKKEVSIYDRSKQQLPHVDFTVTMALEG